MSGSPAFRRALLLAHVLSSVGWFGVVACFLALAIAGVAATDAGLARGVYLVLGWADSAVLVPFAVASLVSGVVQSLCTPWGLVRHYWVVFKLVLTIIATLVLLAYTQTLGHYAQLAATGTPVVDLRAATVAVHAGLALVLLTLTSFLAVFKPRGLTRHGHRTRGSGGAALGGGVSS